MHARARLLYSQFVVLVTALWLVTSGTAVANEDPQLRFERHALDSMLAPIALYPDHLLSQVLMAATYPHEVEEAAQWSRARPGLSGDAAVRASTGWDWDPSVRSLTAFPQVLDTMAQYIQWTRDLGIAFLTQPRDVMHTVQRLRFRAYEAGTLTSTEYTRVVHTGSSVLIESVEPRVLYVPHYDSRVAYGTWWSPAYPPVYWPRWHGYHDAPGRPRVVHWGPGVGLAPGFFFGGVDWPRREVRVVNVHTYYYRPRTVVVERPVEIHRHVHPAPHQHPAPGVWRHDSYRQRPHEAQEPRNARPAPAPAPLVRNPDMRHGPTPSNAAPPARAERAPATAPSREPPPRTQTGPSSREEAAGSSDDRRRSTRPGAEDDQRVRRPARAERD